MQYQIHLLKNDGLMKMLRLTILQRKRVFVYIAMVEGGVAITQSAENRLTIPRFDNRFHDTKEPLIGHDREDQGYKMQWRSLGETTTCVSAQIPTLRIGAKRPQVSDTSQWKNAWVNSFWQDQIVHTRYCGWST